LAYPVLLNAGAGYESRPVTAESLREMARDLDLDIVVQEFATGREVQAAAQRLVAEGTTTLVVAGGDGTVAGVVREVAGTEVTLGILPAGSANNFAAALNIPMSIPAALGIIKDGLVRSVSLGRAETEQESRGFTEAAGIGLFADALALYGDGAEGLSGTLKGLGVALQLLREFHPRPLRLWLDDAPDPVETRAVLCTVANAYRMGAFVPVAPEASLTDDVFDIVLLEDLTRGELLEYYQAAMAGRHLDLPKARAFQARRVRIETDEPTPLPVHADDTVIGATPATLTLLPGALKVLLGHEVRDEL
jgi:diacylglycerol kinase (ATP)